MNAPKNSVLMVVVVSAEYSVNAATAPTMVEKMSVCISGMSRPDSDLR